jgi:hypothetical protein
MPDELKNLPISLLEIVELEMKKEEKVIME